jgi:hypothetical protein
VYFTTAFADARALRSTANDPLSFLAAQMGDTKSELAAAMAATRVLLDTFDLNNVRIPSIGGTAL